MKKEQIYFIVLFTILGFVALQIPLFKLVGSKAAFTVFDFLAPISGSFIGIMPAAISVILIQLINTILHGGFTDIGAVIRLFPTLFGLWYFARRDRALLAVPILAMLVFILHPIGRTVWYYSLFWLIPVACYPLRNRILFARGLGATFTAHAVGGAAWIWAFNLPATVWIGLIPVVIKERLVLALGIMLAYNLFVNLLYVATKKKILALPFSIDQRYVLNILH